MYTPSTLTTALLTLLTAASSTHAAKSSPSSSTITLHAWPLTATKPQPLASIKYWPDHLNASLTSWTPPKISSSSSSSSSSAAAVDADTIVRIGFPGASADDWTGVATSIHSLAPEHLKTITLHLDDTNTVFGIGFSASSPPAFSSSSPSSEQDSKLDTNKATKEKNQKKGGETGKQGQNVVIEVVRPAVGPEPVLNRPVVLTPDGKVPGKEEGEKTFLQKYWWAIALFVLIQVMAGGGESK